MRINRLTIQGRNRGWRSSMLVGVLLLLAGGDIAAAPLSLGKHDFLPVDQAFVLSGELKENEILLRWAIADGYYLYRHKLSFNPSVPLDGKPGMAAGEEREDDFFGTVQVYHHYLEVSLPVKTDLAELSIEVVYQGCAESGLCYSPQTRTLQLTRQTSTTREEGLNPSNPTMSLKKIKSANMLLNNI